MHFFEVPPEGLQFFLEQPINYLKKFK